MDIHDISHRGTTKQKRKDLRIGDIYTNAAICKSCDWFIRSKNAHDFVTCKCGKLSVDGGSFYAKRIGNINNYINIIEMYDDAKDQLENL